MRNVLYVLLEQHGPQLDDESLRTFMVEVESIVNDRPLTVDSLNSPEALEILTPNALLTMKSKVILPPPGHFERVDLYSRKCWRRVQFLSNEFWLRWKREFLQTLQPRNKWLKPHRKMEVNDTVVVKDDNLARNEWKLGRVVSVLPDEDDRVRKVRVMIADSCLDNQGRSVKAANCIERSVHCLVLLLECKIQKTRDSPPKSHSKGVNYLSLYCHDSYLNMCQSISKKNNSYIFDSHIFFTSVLLYSVVYDSLVELSKKINCSYNLGEPCNCRSRNV